MIYILISTQQIHNFTDDESFWKGIADSHNTIADLLGEPIDDSISSIISNPVTERKVIVTISECIPDGWNSDYYISVEDSGAGIKNPSACFSFANTSAGESPLNRYGVALKKVLATFDPDNSYWKLYTRSEQDVSENRIRCVTAPYRSSGMELNITENEEWKGILTGSGTYIEFPCSEALLATAGKEYSSKIKSFSEYVKCLCEDLAVTYIPRIAEGIEITVRMINKDTTEESTVLKHLTPLWDMNMPYDEATVEKDFGAGRCKVHYRIGKIDNHPETQRFFRRNIANSGLMVYENGRLIESNIFRVVWNKVHPSYNAFLAIMEIDPIDDPTALPTPAPTKDSLFYGSPTVMALYDFVRTICPNPKRYTVKSSGKKKEKTSKKEEADLRKKLKEKLIKEYGNRAIIEEEKSFLYNLESSKPRVDIYMYCNEMVTLFECKANESAPLDLFQLQMYHMGAKHDGIEPHILVLVAEKHSESVKEYADYLNSMMVSKTCRYELKTWEDYDIK